MKQLQLIALTISFVWMTEELYKFIHLTHDTSSIALHLSGEEKVEQKSEYEIKEFLNESPVFWTLNMQKTHLGRVSTQYQTPVLSIPDVPPELFR